MAAFAWEAEGERLAVALDENEPQPGGRRRIAIFATTHKPMLAVQHLGFAARSSAQPGPSGSHTALVLQNVGSLCMSIRASVSTSRCNHAISLRKLRSDCERLQAQWCDLRFMSDWSLQEMEVLIATMESLQQTPAMMPGKSGLC